MPSRSAIIRRQLAERDGDACAYCGAALALDLGIARHGGFWQYATIDHVIPRARGGTDDLDNLKLACMRCNCRKGAR